MGVFFFLPGMESSGRSVAWSRCDGLVRTDAPPMKGLTMCEDYPCCGHEQGDCEGLLYGSDELIINDAYRQMELEDMGIYQGEY